LEEKLNSNQRGTKYIFVTGGVLSGLGKGIVAASIGNILKARGLKIFLQKFDQYINVDAGTLNPGEHGEVFVTDDGAETDLDLGHYERFVDTALTQDSSVMTGRIYKEVIERERRGDYLGKTVQIIPQITNNVIEHITGAAERSHADVVIAEIGGTVGDYEGLYYLEAIRQMRRLFGSENVMYIHVVFLPYLGTSKEIKTRPAQYSIRDLQGLGISPAAVMCRSDRPVGQAHLDKIATAADLPREAVIPMETAETVYEVPLSFENYNFGEFILSKLKLPLSKPNHADWENLITRIKADKRKVTIGLVAKYTTMEDTYLSVFEALKSAGWHHNVDIEIKWVDAELLEKSEDKVREELGNVSGILVPGGFGSRGIEGKIAAVKYARENKIPYLGLCLGLQIAAIEFARNVLGLKDANSEEFNSKTKYPVVHIMEYQKTVINLGGTMRLGSYPCKLKPGSLAYRAYGRGTIAERHRHRYEFNNAYRKRFEKAGMALSGISSNDELVEVVELENHPWFVACQFHPEFKSRPTHPHPLFDGFVGASVKTSALF